MVLLHEPLPSNASVRTIYIAGLLANASQHIALKPHSTPSMPIVGFYTPIRTPIYTNMYRSRQTPNQFR